jgi:hypothetical protein
MRCGSRRPWRASAPTAASASPAALRAAARRSSAASRATWRVVSDAKRASDGGAPTPANRTPAEPTSRA